MVSDPRKVGKFWVKVGSVRIKSTGIENDDSAFILRFMMEYQVPNVPNSPFEMDNFWNMMKSIYLNWTFEAL